MKVPVVAEHEEDYMSGLPLKSVLKIEVASVILCFSE